MLENPELETKVALQIVRDAHKEGIPLVADIESHRWTNRNIVVRHYDFGRDLSLSEIRVIQQLCNIAAVKCEAHLQFTLETLRFAVSPMPGKKLTRRGWQSNQEETDAAIAKYIEACQPRSSERKETEDVIGEWRYLTWPINCNCN